MVDVFAATTEAGEYYVGHAQGDPERLGFIYAMISPVTDSRSIATYGERIHKMYRLILDVRVPLVLGNLVKIDEQMCKVIELLRYSEHSIATVERLGKK